MARISNQNVLYLQNFLINWFKTNKRQFPWRNNQLSNYQIIIAETLLQRTKAETVSAFYSKFIDDFPNWKSLASADNFTLEKYLKPIGLYQQRAKRLKNLAIEMERRNGVLPKNRSELESIPFLGQYISNAIELLIFKQPSPLVDVNMARLLERYFQKRKMADIRYDPLIQSLSYKLVNHTNAKEINWAILDYSALICTARNPKCDICLLAIKCTTNKNIK